MLARIDGYYKALNIVMTPRTKKPQPIRKIPSISTKQSILALTPHALISPEVSALFRKIDMENGFTQRERHAINASLAKRSINKDILRQHLQASIRPMKNNIDELQAALVYATEIDKPLIIEKLETLIPLYREYVTLANTMRAHEIPLSDIDNYRVNTDNNAAESNAELVEKYLGDAAEILREGTTKSTTAREAFVDYLNNLLAKNDNIEVSPKTTPEEDAVLLKDLLGGTEFLELYHAAIQEERNSQAYRDAVFLASKKHYEGAQWKNN